MINRIIEFSAHNRFIVFLLVAAAAVGGLVVDAERPARRHPGPERHPGDRLLALGPQPRHRRRPGHLPDRHRDAGRAEGEGRPRLLRFRLLLRLHHLRGRHRHLLGALAHAGVPLERPAAPAAGRRDRARPGRDRRRLGVPVRAGGHEPAQHDLAELRSLPGLVSCATTSRRCRAWPKWRRSAASCGSTR